MDILNTGSGLAIIEENPTESARDDPTDQNRHENPGAPRLDDVKDNQRDSLKETEHKGESTDAVNQNEAKGQLSESLTQSSVKRNPVESLSQNDVKRGHAESLNHNELKKHPESGSHGEVKRSSPHNQVKSPTKKTEG